MSRSKFYITTAIDYPNGAPHMGHAYEKVVTDVYARWARLRGDTTFFLTGTDENGQKLVKAAEAAGQKTKAYVDFNADLFRKLCQDLQISNDGFIRTTDSDHFETAQAIWAAVEKNGDIYFDKYSGLYCLACEAFYTETQTPDGKCPTHGTPLQTVQEEGYFFRLSKYASWIREHIEKNSDFIRPKSAQTEMLRRIDSEPVKDLSVSRPNQGWGIPVPSNEKYVMYTWFDALINYLTPFFKDLKGPKSFWPADLHVIGKDITWFHTVIWPCLLKSAGIALPKQVYVHGMVLGQDGRKMSKSLGNGVDPQEVISKYPLESFKYYLLRAIPSGGDGAFVTKDMLARHNSELANDYGNLLMRVVKFILKKTGPKMDSSGVKANFDFRELGSKMNELMNAREHSMALELLWKEIGRMNLYLTENAPWKMDVADPKFKEVLYNALYGIHCFATLVAPFLPTISSETLKFLGTTEWAHFAGLEFGKAQFTLSEPVALFPKIEV